jgi:hypothetical protein
MFKATAEESGAAPRILSLQQRRVLSEPSGHPTGKLATVTGKHTKALA